LSCVLPCFRITASRLQTKLHKEEINMVNKEFYDQKIRFRCKKCGMPTEYNFGPFAQDQRPVHCHGCGILLSGSDVEEMPALPEKIKVIDPFSKNEITASLDKENLEYAARLTDSCCVYFDLFGNHTKTSS